jgi:hypothetical protein
MRACLIGALALVLIGCSSDGEDTTGASGPAGSSSTTTSASSATSGGDTGGAGGGGQGGAGGAGQGGAGQGGGSGGAGGGSAGVWGPDKCPETPAGAKVGFEVGDQLADIVVKTCDGVDVSLTELCGADALFIFASHGWCPLCKNATSQQEALHDGYAGMNLASVNIIVANAQDDPPDSDFCKLWRDQYGLEDVATFYDPTGAVLALWPGGSSSLSAYVDKDRLITGKLVHDSNIQNIKAEIQKALDQ